MFPPDDGLFQDVGTLSGLIPVATSVNELRDLLMQARRADMPFDTRQLSAVGIPENALENAALHAEVLLHRSRTR